MDHSEVKHLKVDHEPAELAEAGRILLKAAVCIEKEGWYPGDKGAGARCAALAINDVSKDSEQGERVREVFAKAIGLGSGLCGTIGRWNDAPGRTKDEVVAKLRAVALGL